MRADYPHRHSSAIFVSVQFWPEVVIRSPPFSPPPPWLPPSPTITCFASPYGARTQSVGRSHNICQNLRCKSKWPAWREKHYKCGERGHTSSSFLRPLFTGQTPLCSCPLFPISESRCRIEIMQIKATATSARMRSFVMGLHKSRRHQPPLPEVTTEHHG